MDRAGGKLFAAARLQAGDRGRRKGREHAVYLRTERILIFTGYFGHLLFYAAVWQLGKLFLGEAYGKVRRCFPAFFSAAAVTLLLWLLLRPSMALVPEEGSLYLTLAILQRSLQIVVLPLWWMRIFFGPLPSITGRYFADLYRRAKARVEREP